jgi:isocitrate dehydrogenase kinase/phosphatase
VVVDAVFTSEDDVSILFGFAHSYFHVVAERPYDLVQFIKSLMPRKRIAELYTSIGHHKHGKTELYRDLLDHLASTGACFEAAPGEAGLVMMVFTMPDYDMVFKIVRDSFGVPKQTTREAVMEKYRVVFRHDRVGRLIDAQEFEHLAFDRRRFDEGLLEVLLTTCGRTVGVAGDRVTISHCYVERRVEPLNLYIRTAGEEAARLAVVDYGRAVKDLAAANIFPGDLLIKNFGVTRHGRVVFYDYDELADLTSCVFRELPGPVGWEDELGEFPTYGVGPDDVFPSEFRSFLGMPGKLREVFEHHHEDLYTVGFWQSMKARHEAGEIVEFFPYDQSERLANT